MERSVFDASPSGGAANSGDIIPPQAWCDLILQRCGLAFRQAKLQNVMEAVREQVRLRGLVNDAALYQLLSKPSDNAGEWDALIEQLINHETSFFRHPPSFEALRRHILPEVRDNRVRGARLSLWSAGCSTGQETYSLAMVAM